nr:MAG TPA_asm: hypothetical protein [Caudoviricetes sp.]
MIIICVNSCFGAETLSKRALFRQKKHKSV